MPPDLITTKIETMSTIDTIREKLAPIQLPDPAVGLSLYFEFLPSGVPVATGDTTPQDGEWAYNEFVTKRTAPLGVADQVTLLIYGLGANNLCWSSFTTDEQSFLKAQYVDPLCQRANVNLEYGDLVAYTNSELLPPPGCKYLKVILKQQ